MLPPRPPARLPARLAVLATAGVLALTGGPAAAADLPTGPDVASWQHPGGAAIDWAAVRAGGQSFAFVKASEGATYTNPYFAGDWAGARAAGLYRGAYHYARPDATLGDAVAEAQHFATVLGATNAPGDLPPVLDMENSGGLTPDQLATWTATFLTTVEAATGRAPIIYTYPNFWATRMGGSAAFTRYPLWIAHYGVTAPATGPWPRWTFWQHTNAGTVPGIPTVGGTDLNRFNGTAAALARLALVPAQPSLSLAVGRSPVRYGTEVGLAGRLRGPDGTALPGAHIRLYQRPGGASPWQTLATVRTAADGTYAHRLRPRAAVQLTARSVATASDLAAASPSVTVRVAAGVQGRWSTRTVRQGTVVRLRGTVGPHRSGTLVSRQVWDGKRWKAAAKVRTDPSGRFAFPVRVRADTPRRHRVVAAPAGYVPGTLVLPSLRIR